MSHCLPDPNLGWAILKDDYLHVYTKEGIEILGTTHIRLTDIVDQPAEVLVKFLANICSSEEEMNKKIEEFKNKKWT